MSTGKALILTGGVITMAMVGTAMDIGEAATGMAAIIIEATTADMVDTAVIMGAITAVEVTTVGEAIITAADIMAGTTKPEALCANFFSY